MEAGGPSFEDQPLGEREAELVRREVTYLTEKNEEKLLGEVLAPVGMDFAAERVAFLKAAAITQPPIKGQEVFKGNFLSWLYTKGASPVPVEKPEKADS